MSKPILHPLIAERLGGIIQNPPHALLLAGPAGIGKATIVHWLAAQLLQADLAGLNKYPHVLRLESDGGKAIGIEAVRQLEHFISLQVASNRTVDRLAILYDAHLLTTEAQNALLKTLEEPPAGTVLLLTTSAQDALLPTVRSRLQTVEVIPPSREDLKAELISRGVQTDKLAAIMALSGGLPGLAFALAEDDQDHPLVAAAQTARQLLQESTFEKLCRVDVLAKNKDSTANLIYILMQMAHAALLTGRSSERWQKVLTVSYAADTALKQGTQPKLALTNLMINL